jgi:hypothetical protein
MQFSFGQLPVRRVFMADLQGMLGFVSPKLREALLLSAEALQRLGIRYAVAGGFAVGAYGYIRATTDVDFLVGEEAFEHHGALVTFKPGVPIQVGGVLVDYLSAAALGKHLEETINHPTSAGELPVVSIEALIYMKLLAKRRKDLLDVTELLKAGADAKKIREYLQQHASEQLPLFESLLLELP